MPNVINPPAGEIWLSLKDAAARLRVHAATLRRWADDGDIPHMLTPGGHRRFAVSDLDQFADAHRVTQRPSKESLPEAWAARAMTRARQDVPQQANEHWLATLDDQVRQQHRALGQRLMGLTLQYVSTDDGQHLLEEARAVGRDYGRLSLAAGMPLSDALQAALFFRDRLLEATLDLSETGHVRPGDNSRLVKRINTLLNAVQLATAEAYEAAPGPAHTPSLQPKQRRARKTSG